jgi:hypothetical protein
VKESELPYNMTKIPIYTRVVYMLILDPVIPVLKSCTKEIHPTVERYIYKFYVFIV